jgi:putative oxidoreductase
MTFTQLVRTERTYSPLVICVTLGIVLFAHGALSLLGWFGGHGF